MSPFLKTFPVRGGGNTLKATLPRRVSGASDTLTVVLTDARGRKATYTANVVVPI